MRALKLSLTATFLLMIAQAQSAPPVYGYKVVRTYPHSTQSYTEGFFYLDGLFYEGTGLAGQSALRAIQPETGKVVQESDLDPKYFGEGIVDAGPNILEWTWQSHIGFVIDRFSFRVVREFHYTGEGWGMTRMGNQIVTSDGSSTLRFRDPNTFAETRHITVHEGLAHVRELNELEYVKGEIYANVWHTDRIVRISPKDGRVLGWIDLRGLLRDEQRVNGEAVLNGIAYDAKGDRLFVTGKQWPAIFEIKLVPPAKALRL
jgi:glutamine cyclotransferase